MIVRPSAESPISLAELFRELTRDYAEAGEVVARLEAALTAHEDPAPWLQAIRQIIEQLSFRDLQIRQLATGSTGATESELARLRHETEASLAALMERVRLACERTERQSKRIAGELHSDGSWRRMKHVYTRKEQVAD